MSDLLGTASCRRVGGLPAPDALAQVEALQQQVNALRAELESLRQRDETLNRYTTHLDEELRLAAKLQREFLPKQLPQVGHIRFSTLFRPAGHVSGDLYDIVRLDEQHVGFYLADAVGHGMPAALLTMFIKRALVTKEIVPGGYRLLSPGESIQRLNDALAEQNLSSAAFATAIYGLLNTQTLQLTFATGGHPTPLLAHRAGDALVPLPAQGALLGIFAGETYRDATVQLAPGDRLFIFTDGIEVAFDAPGDNALPRWQHELLSRAHLSGEQLVADLSRLLDQQPPASQTIDDLTLIVADIG